MKKLILALLFCLCGSVAAALGQTQQSSNNQSMHAASNSSFSASQLPLITAGGYMQSLRNDNKSALRIDDRAALRMGGNEPGGHTVSKLKTGITKNTGDTRTTSENLTLNLDGVRQGLGVPQNAQPTGRSFSESQSPVVHDYAAHGSLSCCSTGKRSLSGTGVLHRSQAFARASGPFDHPSYDLPTTPKVGMSTNRSSRNESRDEFRFGSFGNHFGERHFRRFVQTPMQKMQSRGLTRFSGPSEP